MAGDGRWVVGGWWVVGHVGERGRGGAERILMRPGARRAPEFHGAVNKNRCIALPLLSLTVAVGTT